MNKERYGLITFKSTNHALQGEQILEREKLIFKTIPTPREVSTSCGLSLLFLTEDIEKIKELAKKGDLSVAGIYKYSKSSNGSQAERIL